MLKKDYLDIDLLIRCIQKAEGNSDCFRRFRESCDETGCCWRPYCLEAQQETMAGSVAGDDRWLVSSRPATGEREV